VRGAVGRPHSSGGLKYKYICICSVKLRDTWEVREALCSLCAGHGVEHFSSCYSVCSVSSHVVGMPQYHVCWQEARFAGKHNFIYMSSDWRSHYDLIVSSAVGLKAELTISCCNTSLSITWIFKVQWSLYVPPGLILRNSAFCPHSVFMCFVWI
jgi:hypothetical protein